VRGYLFLMFLAIGSVFAVLGLKQLFIDPLPSGAFGPANLFWLAVQTLPLLALLPQLLGGRGGRRLAGGMAALAGMAYFCFGVWLSVGEHSSLGLALVAGSLVIVAVGSLIARAAGAVASD
jgi:hypothetical protein